AETSKTAFRVKLSGFINTHPDEQTLQAGEHSPGVATLRVGAYNQTYQFEVIYAQALDNPQVSAGMILQQLHKYAVDFEVTGPRGLLQKLGLAEPGTPLTLTGFFRQYNRGRIAPRGAARAQGPRSAARRVPCSGGAAQSPAAGGRPRGV